MPRTSRSRTTPQEPYERRLDSSVRFRLAEASEYFGKRGTLHQTLKELDKRLKAEGVAYALLGALAMYMHGYYRMTTDVDVLMTAEALERFKQSCLGRGYSLAFQGAQRTFRDTHTGVRIEVIIAGEYPGDGKPKPVSFPDPQRVACEMEGIAVVNLAKLIELKLASGLSAAHRASDLGDVIALIRSLHLRQKLSASLDPSVRGKYLELWQAAQAQDVVQEQEPEP